jgi:hypothetical protein
VDEEVELAPLLLELSKTASIARAIVGDVAMAGDTAPISAASGSTRFFSASP